MDTDGYMPVPQEVICKEPTGNVESSHQPTGLEYLTYLDTVVVEKLPRNAKKIEWVLKNSNGQEAYHIMEESDAWQRRIYGKARAFHMKVYDNLDRPVFQILRDVSCWSQSPCTIQSSNGVIGYTDIKLDCSGQYYRIQSPDKNTVLRITRPPFCEQLCCVDKHFKIKSEHEKIGKIARRTGGFLGTMMGGQDKYEVKFPIDLDVNMKCIILGAVMLINNVERK